MSDAGNALLGIGMGTGERRAIDAAEQAVASPLLETSMEGARSILLSITGGPNLSLWEVNEAAKAVAEAAHPDANIIFGAMLDEKLDDQVWVTVVATGYGDGADRAARRHRADGRAPATRAARRAAGQPVASAARARRELTSPNSAPAADGRSCAWRRPRSLDVPRVHSCVLAMLAPTVSDATSPQLGVIAAGHPLTRAGRRRRAARAAATRSTPRSAAMLASFACEPLLTGLGAGGYMLVVAPGQRAGAARLLRRGARARRRSGGARGADPDHASRSATRSRCSTSARRRSGRTGCRPGSARRPRGSAGSRSRSSSRRRRGSRATASSSTRQQAYVVEILGRHRHLDAGVRGAVRARGARAARRRRVRQPELADALERLGARGRRRRSTPATSPRRSSSGSRSAAGSLTAAGSRRVRGGRPRRRSGSATAGARCSPTRRRRPAGS